MDTLNLTSDVHVDGRYLFVANYEGGVLIYEHGLPNGERYSVCVPAVAKAHP